LATVSTSPATCSTAIIRRVDSLAARLIAAAAVWTLLGLFIGGYVLSGVFRASVESDFDQQLKSELDDMIAAAIPSAGNEVSLQGRFTDPRFERVYSGWYWQIVPWNAQGPLLDDAQISRSLFDHTIKITDSHLAAGLTWGHGAGPENQRLRFVSQRIEFGAQPKASNNAPRAFVFLVAADVTVVEDEVDRFNGILFWSFALLGVGLVIAVFIQVRIGLEPLGRVSQALARIREGRARRLDGRFPAEIAPLAAELNSLIDHNAEVVARARTHVSNLAHFLKTPLSVLSSEADANAGPLADSVKRQVATMRRQVDHYLARARVAGALDVLGNRTPVRPVIEDLSRVLKRIHAERALWVTVECPENLAFRGERQDLEEMAGNLIDNACKWAHGRVAVTARRTSPNSLELCVEDDGQGLSAEERTRVGERGERLDESVPGTGLGLAIVRDIAKLYGGEVSLAQASLGGLEVRLALPAIAEG
jgi:signal transduction histidine kinase